MASSGIDYVGMLDLFDCPICTEFMYPPIYQCPNGHTLCSNCKPKIEKYCPICKNKVMKAIRCLMLEKAGGFLRFPCKYHEEGCLDWFKYSRKRNHEEKHCRYRPHNCHFLSCQNVVLGNAGGLVSHLKNEHNASIKHGCQIDSLFTFRHDLNDESRTYCLEIYSCYSQHFCLHFEMAGASGDYIYIYLTLVGEEMDAKTFFYKLAIGNGHRKMTLRGSPGSNRELSKPATESYDGLVLHKSMVHIFAEKNIDDQLCASMEKNFCLKVRGSICDQE